jgi:8-oxo-dGTP pyrophosphatase MutT (NUDIX family)
LLSTLNDVVKHEWAGQKILDWRPGGDPGLELQVAMRQLHLLGHLKHWRGELQALRDDDPEHPSDSAGEVLRVERTAFRYLGLRSRAAHVNGVVADGPRAGWMWIARRAKTKKVDPGKLDNLAAGGVAAAETARECAVRELGEEAGVPDGLARTITAYQVFHARGVLDDALHDEFVHTFDLLLPSHFIPRPVDGEVDEFVCLPAGQVIQRIRAGEFTYDAAAVFATWGMRHMESHGDGNQRH